MAGYVSCFTAGVNITAYTIAVLHSSTKPIQTILEGSTVFFECVTNTTLPIRWRFKARDGDGHHILIYTGERFVDYWTPQQRSRVEFDNVTGRGQLIIGDVEISDAGEYVCFEKKTTVPGPIRFELKVVSREGMATEILLTK